ncbi:unnamed protein product [Penicillium bialowiezense]
MNERSTQHDQSCSCAQRSSGSEDAEHAQRVSLKGSGLYFFLPREVSMDGLGLYNDDMCAVDLYTSGLLDMVPWRDGSLRDWRAIAMHSPSCATLLPRQHRLVTRPFRETQADSVRREMESPPQEAW